VYLTVISLDKYGYRDDAVRIAKKYIDVNTALFQKYSKLYEKTDAETGDISYAEYASTPMMGWTAGVYVVLAEFLGFAK
jgi:alpha,alpha-trehalase